MKREKKNVALSRTLRKQPTDAETRLWKHFRRQQLGGFKFRRQEPIGPYIVDFVCYETRIIVEADGGQHANNEKDTNRDDYLESQKFKILRFWNREILKNTQKVIEAIEAECQKSLWQTGKD